MLTGSLVCTVWYETLVACTLILISRGAGSYKLQDLLALLLFAYRAIHQHEYQPYQDLAVSSRRLLLCIAVVVYTCKCKRDAGAVARR
jgi:hypothetical protein